MSLLEAKQLHLRGDDTALSDISFEISEKGIYGFLGKSGSGKSLLASVLSGTCAPDEGDVLYRDQSVYATDKQAAAVRKRIGYVPSKVIYDGDATIYEILDLIGRSKKIDPDKRVRQIKEALELMGLSHKRQVLSEELTLPEKRRLSMAAALIGNPEIIIIDEPFKALDSKQSAEIKKLIELLSGKKVVLLFSARPTDIEENCENVAILSHGNLVLWERTELLLRKLKDNGLGGLSNALDAFSEKEGE